jgi:hypothetical protein
MNRWPAIPALLAVFALACNAGGTSNASQRSSAVRYGRV